LGFRFFRLQYNFEFGLAGDGSANACVGIYDIFTTLYKEEVQIRNVTPNNTVFNKNNQQHTVVFSIFWSLF